MRDERFVAEHRGGLLPLAHHRLLMLWACTCAEHLLPLLRETLDERLPKALDTGRAWTEGKVPTGHCMKASVAAHAAARQYAHPVDVAVARAIGQAVATAHMADHAPGPALYGLKAVKLAGGDVDAERSWQNAQLPKEIKDLILSARAAKESAFIKLR